MKQNIFLTPIGRVVFLSSLIFFASFVSAQAQTVTVQYSTTSDWGSGFQGEIKITNNGTQAINGWTLAFDLNRNITSVFDAAVISHVGNRYTIRNQSYNATIPAGGNVTFGFVGSPGNITVANHPSNYVFNNTPLSITPSTFTYQGRLSNGAAANGAFDLQFVLYDEAGVQIGATVTRENTAVTNGVFTVQLDFGETAFFGASRSLEIKVRPGAETGAFTTLAPRQFITVAPKAIYSINSAQLGGVAAGQYVLTSDPRLTTTVNVTGNGTIGGNLTVTGTISSGCRSGFTAFASGRLCVSAMQTAANFWNAVTACKNLSARVGNSADVMMTFSDTNFNYFGGLSSGWLADHIGDDTWGTWNVTSPNSNFDGASQPAGSTILPFRCVY